VIFFGWQSAGAQDSAYRNLALEGGGIRGLAFSGAIKALDSLGFLQPIQRVAGTSSGSIQAMLLASGHATTEINALSRNLHARHFKDGGYFFIGGGVRLRRRYGYYKGEALNNWVQKRLEIKTGNPNLTFRQLDSLSEVNNNFKKLLVVVTDLSNQRTLVISGQNMCDMRICDAVTASCAIPFFYKPLVTDKNGKRLSDKATGPNVLYLADGGLVANYPYFVFDTLPGKTLGIILERPDLAETLNKEGTVNNRFTINNLIDYTNACYNVVLQQQKSLLQPDVITKHTIAISTGDISPRIRKLRKKETNMLIQNGRLGVEQYYMRTKNK